MFESLRNNPVRIFAVVASVVALAAHYIPNLPTALILAIPAAILGVGEMTRSKVTPNERVVLHVDELAEMIQSANHGDES